MYLKEEIMRIKAQLLFSVSLIAVFLVCLGYFSLYKLSLISFEKNQTVFNLKTTLDDVILARQEARYAKLLMYYDEILTSSAIIYAHTSNTQWAERYFANEPELDKAVKGAMMFADFSQKQFLKEIDDSNIALVKMEYKSIDLTKKGSNKEAIALLEGAEYKTQKEIYALNLAKYASLAERRFDVISSEAIGLVQISNDKILEISKNSRFQILVFVSVLLVFSIFLIIFITKKVLFPLEHISDAMNQISLGNFRVSINDRLKFQKNEVGILASSLDRILVSMKLAIFRAKKSANLIKKEGKNEK